MLVALAMTATAQAGTAMTIGNLRFEAPDAASGWEAKQIEGGMILQKTFAGTDDTEQKGAAIIEIFGPMTAPTTSLDTTFAAVASTVKGLADERPTRKGDGITTNGHRIRSDDRCCAEMKGLSVAQRTVGIASEAGHQAFFGLVALKLHGEARTAAEATFAALVRSVLLEPDDKPFALEPRSTDGGLDGVYTHLNNGLRLNAFGGMDFDSENEILVFDPAGLYTKTLPENGDVAAQCRAMPTSCGLYALKGGVFGKNQIEMRQVDDALGTIGSRTKPFGKTNDGFDIDGGSYNRLPPFPPGTTFDGTWRYFFAAVGSTALSSSSVSSERFLVFARDGTFRREGWAGASGSTDAGSGTVGFATGAKKQPATKGRYKIEGYRMELVADDGETERLSIFAPDKDSDKLLVIGGANYLKQD